MGRPRLDRRVVSHSLAKDTVDRIDLLRDHEQKRLAQRRTRVTLSEIIDNAVRLLDQKTFMDEDPTRGGRFFVDWKDTEKWQCPSCIDGNYNEGEAPLIAGGFVICPYAKCGKPRPTASYPEPLRRGGKLKRRARLAVLLLK